MRSSKINRFLNANGTNGTLGIYYKYRVGKEYCPPAPYKATILRTKIFQCKVENLKKSKNSVRGLRGPSPGALEGREAKSEFFLNPLFAEGKKIS